MAVDKSTVGATGKPAIRINFADFWGHFEPTSNYFWDLLSKSFDLELSDDPDFLLYSAYGREFKKYDCFRIFYTGEAGPPDWGECDFAFSFDYMDDPRQYRLPLYALYADNSILTRKRDDPEAILRGKTSFCNFVVSNPSCRKRNEFFQRLSRYKKVDSAGKFMNNIGRTLNRTPQDKWEFIRPYKFTIAFESKPYPGYTTEKIFEPMMVDSLPIYWGNPLVRRDFNTRSFLNYYDFENDEHLIERVIELDRDDALYSEYLREPWFTGNKVNAFVDPANVTRQFEFIFSHKGRSRPVARSPLKFYSAGKGALIWSRSKVAVANDKIRRILP